MTDITMQYDWNNHKEMNQKRLIDTFMRLALSDKLKVYRTLKEKRRLLLRKGYEQWKKTQDKEAFEEDRHYFLEPFTEHIDMSDIKTDYELDLTLAILLTVDSRAYADHDTSNLHKEEESFNRTKEKMISWIGSTCIRNNPTARYQKDIENTFEYNLISELEKLKYVAPTTPAQHTKRETAKWKECYKYIGVGEERAKRLVTGLGKQIILFHEHTPTSDIMFTYDCWKDNIVDDLKTDLLELLDCILDDIPTQI